MTTQTAAKATTKHLARRTWAVRHALADANYRTPVDYFERLAVYAELLCERVEAYAAISPQGTKKALADARTVAANARRDADQARRLAE